MTTASETLQKTIEAFNRHDADGFASLYAPDAVAEDPQYPDPLRGREAIRKDIADFFTSFPDVRAEMSNVFAEGDTVGCEVEIRGTNLGPLVTPEGNLEPTRRSVRIPGSRFVRVDETGRIRECRRYFDMAGLMRQLGMGDG